MTATIRTDVKALPCQMFDADYLEEAPCLVKLLESYPLAAYLRAQPRALKELTAHEVRANALEVADKLAELVKAPAQVLAQGKFLAPTIYRFLETTTSRDSCVSCKLGEIRRFTEEFEKGNNEAYKAISACFDTLQDLLEESRSFEAEALHSQTIACIQAVNKRAKLLHDKREELRAIRGTVAEVKSAAEKVLHPLNNREMFPVHARLEEILIRLKMLLKEVCKSNSEALAKLDAITEELRTVSIPCSYANPGRSVIASYRIEEQGNDRKEAIEEALARIEALLEYVMMDQKGMTPNENAVVNHIFERMVKEELLKQDDETTSPRRLLALTDPVKIRLEIKPNLEWLDCAAHLPGIEWRDAYIRLREMQVSKMYKLKEEPAQADVRKSKNFFSRFLSTVKDILADSAPYDSDYEDTEVLNILFES